MALHPLDLPPLRGSPSYEVLKKTLSDLIQPPASFSAPPPEALPAGTITWLTRLVSSSLSQLTDEESEEIISLGSAILSSECGRSAAPSMTRSFTVPVNASSSATITIHEPTLTADSLGLKTWSTSFHLSRVLSQIFKDESEVPALSILELGSGTGLVGIATSKVLTSSEITLTDYLPEITRNLQHNVELNHVVNARVAWLDWTKPNESSVSKETFDFVVASDFMYDQTHPNLVADMFDRFTTPKGRVLAAYPLRPSNVDFIKDFHDEMATMWIILNHGVETGYDDWGGDETVTVHWYLYAHTFSRENRLYTT